MSTSASSSPGGAQAATPPLRILHCMRAPVGGLFRHVRDLAREQAAKGHAVGLICDASTGGADARALLAELEPACGLGIARINMGRLPGLSDAVAARAVGAIAREKRIDILHGHGAKGGAYARLAPWSGAGRGVGRFYTPHGGSLHYASSSPAGFVFLTLERLLLKRTSGLIFESAFSRDAYFDKVAHPACPVRVIHNGVCAEEFEPVAPAGDAADLVFVGELRRLKGISTLLQALARLNSDGRRVSAALIGDGAERDRLEGEARELGLGGQVVFHGAMPARRAFALGRILVVPSLAESFPYIVLEALAAAKPVLATRVGGIPEMFAGESGALLPPGDAAALAEAIAAALDGPKQLTALAGRLQQRVRANFSTQTMAEQVESFYRDTLA